MAAASTRELKQNSAYARSFGEALKRSRSIWRAGCFSGLSRSGAGCGASSRLSPHLRRKRLAFGMKSLEVIMIYALKFYCNQPEIGDISAPRPALRRIGDHGALAQIIPR